MPELINLGMSTLAPHPGADTTSKLVDPHPVADRTPPAYNMNLTGDQLTMLKNYADYQKIPAVVTTDPTKPEPQKAQ